MEKKNSNKALIVFAVILLLCAAVAAGAYFLTRPAGVVGEKSVTIVIDIAGSAPQTVKVNTDEEYLGPLLLAEGLAEGEVSEFGLFISKVGGRTADAGKQEW